MQWRELAILNRCVIMRRCICCWSLRRGEAGRKEFFDRIIEVVSLLGGDGAHAL